MSSSDGLSQNQPLEATGNSEHDILSGTTTALNAFSPSTAPSQTGYILPNLDVISQSPPSSQDSQDSTLQHPRHKRSFESSESSDRAVQVPKLFTPVASNPLRNTESAGLSRTADEGLSFPDATPVQQPGVIPHLIRTVDSATTAAPAPNSLESSAAITMKG